MNMSPSEATSKENHKSAKTVECIQSSSSTSTMRYLFTCMECAGVSMFPCTSLQVQNLYNKPADRSKLWIRTPKLLPWKKYTSVNKGRPMEDSIYLICPFPQTHDKIVRLDIQCKSRVPRLPVARGKEVSGAGLFCWWSGKAVWEEEAGGGGRGWRSDEGRRNEHATRFTFFPAFFLRRTSPFISRAKQ